MAVLTAVVWWMVAGGAAPHVLPAPADAIALPRGARPAIGAVVPQRAPGPAPELVTPSLVDRRRRIPRTRRPEPFGDTLLEGERFEYDVVAMGNSAGVAWAEIRTRREDPRGGPPQGSPIVELYGHARTSGVVSLLATITDDMRTELDGETGTTLYSENRIERKGLGPGYRSRISKTLFLGRGYSDMRDERDGKHKRKRRRLPLDTFDPLGAMAWVRALDLKKGERAKAHALDGKVLLRLEVTARGRTPAPDMPSLARALGIGPGEATLYEGVLTRVDEYDTATEGKRVYTMKAWFSDDGRRIPLLVESDMWLGSLQLRLRSYDPPRRARETAQ